MAANRNQRGLGRGLSALLADADIGQENSPKTAKDVETLPIEYLEANPNQPRKQFDQAELDELANSIGEKGIIQPILVRKLADERYQIIAGERRWRAAGMARLHNVPVIVRDYTDNEVAEIALIENIQRANLNPIEEARGYEDLVNRGNTQEEVAKVTGKSRSHIANMLRILKLNPEVRNLVAEGKVSFGHAKLLASSESSADDAKWVIANNASVRDLEKHLASKGAVGVETKSAKGAKRAGNGKDADTKQLEADLSAALGTKVKIDHKSGGNGSITIGYKDLNQLDSICQKLT